MDMRVALNNGKVLRFDNGSIEYIIQGELARGGSSIVYNAQYTDNAGHENTVRIKECYPVKLNISRDSIDNLIPAEGDISEFEQAKNKMREAYNRSKELFKTDGLTNFISNTYNIYESNKTIYIVSVYSQGEKLSYNASTSLKERLSIVKSVASAILSIHNKGYLCLDIKPDNIFTLSGTTEIVQLFDFDSLIPIDIQERNKCGYDEKISYTKGFAALEQQMGLQKKIGKHSDVYGIGAVLFYLVFGKAPNAIDCGFDAAYDFSLSKFDMQLYQDKLTFKLTDFFHNTLANHYLDRLQNMEAVIEKLDELIRLSDTTVPFIFSTKITEPKFVTGRNSESNYLSEWFSQNKRNCLFVTGMGGIGKSTLVSFFLSQNLSNFDTVIYTNYNISIVRTITDDTKIKINTIQKDENESLDEYFIRKLNKIRDLSVGKKIVLVVDNYIGEANQDFSDILEIDWKVVFISRNKPLAQGYDLLEIKAIRELKNLYLLFENNLGKPLSEDEYVHIDSIIKKVAGHTLVIELIARQIAASHISVAEASSLVNVHGFSDIAPEKIDYTKDFASYHKTIREIIGSLFNATHFSESKKTITKIISLFGTNGVNIDIFSEMLELESKNDINELISEGWINIAENKRLFMHPVLMETVYQWDLTENLKKTAIRVLEYLYKQIKLEGRKEEYPKKFNESQRNLKKIFESDEFIQLYSSNTFFKKIVNKISHQNDLIGEIVWKRMFTSDEKQVSDYQKITLFLQLAESYLEGCKKEKPLLGIDIYKNLLYQTIINMPHEREDFILYSSEELIKNYRNLNGVELLNLYDEVVSIYEEKRDFESAYNKIVEAKSLLKKYRNYYIRGRYFYLCAGYYDAILDGSYDAETDEEKKLLEFLLDNLDKAIRCMEKSGKIDGKHSLGRCYISKACILARSTYENTSEQIKEFLKKAKRYIDENVQAHSKLYIDYYIACAWYHTYVDRDFEKADDFIHKAGKINDNTCYNELDKIDHIISFANISFETGKYIKAADYIDSAIERCDEYKGILVYSRKKIELLHCLLEIYYQTYDFEKCRGIIERITNDIEVVEGINIEQVVPREWSENIFSQ